MVLLLNYLPLVIAAIALYLSYYFAKKHRGTDKAGKRVVQTLAVGLILIFVLGAVSNGYLGKAVGDKLAAPTADDLATEAEEAPPMRDVLRKPPQTAEESTKAFNELTDWRKHKADREKPKQEATQTQELPLPPEK